MAKLRASSVKQQQKRSLLNKNMKMKKVSAGHSVRTAAPQTHDDCDGTSGHRHAAGVYTRANSPSRRSCGARGVGRWCWFSAGEGEAGEVRPVVPVEQPGGVALKHRRLSHGGH